ncbi:MAG: Crp/Fnr family transcriptional regulator [Saprospiraceae bacterium]
MQNRLSTDINQEILKIIQTKFDFLNEAELQKEIAANAKLMHFKAGDTLMDYGSFIQIVPLVVDGVLKVMREDENGNEIFLYFINAGQSCTMSFSCCIRNKRSEIRAVVEDDVTLIGIPVQSVDAWMMKFQSWKTFIMSSYDARLNELIYAIDNIAFSKMDERLIRYLEDKSFALNTMTIHTTHQDIATDLNASREAVSRLLKKLEISRRVKLGRNRITLLTDFN